jgi:hypothetical protein
LRDLPEDSTEFLHRISWLPWFLVLRVIGEDSRYSHNNYESFRCHRVLRDVPGHSRQRRGPVRWRRRRSGLRCRGCRFQRRARSYSGCRARQA